MRAGTLDQRVKIQRPVKTTDPQWGTGQGWADVATVWAGVKAIAGGESEKDQGTQSTTRFEIRMRYRNDVSSANQLVWKGRTLDIVSAIDPDSSRRELVIVAAEHAEVTS